MTKLHRYINYISYFILLTGLYACVEPYDPNISKYENVFVVDGELNNLPGPYKVTLSRSYDYYKSKAKPVSGAKLKIIDNTGIEAHLKEMDAGEYITVDSTFVGIVGNSYKIHIEYNNEIYESEYQTLKKPVSIDKVYWEYKVQNNESKGIQLFVDTHDPNNEARYYSWDFEETWKIVVPIDYPQKPEWKECYAKSKSTRFIIATSLQLNNDIIENQPLSYINENTNRLFYRYTMLVKQRVLSKTSYTYIKDIIQLNQNQGTLFDPMPYSLVGNIKNINKQEPVLGYFLVNGVSEKRIFIDRSELPKAFLPIHGFETCSEYNFKVPTDKPASSTNIRKDPTIDSLLNIGHYEINRAYILKPVSLDTISVWVLLAKPTCFNCTMSGEQDPPDFWTEKEIN